MFLVHIFLCIKLGFFFFLHAMVFFCASKRRKKNQISYQAAFYVSMFYDGKSWKRQIFSIFSAEFWSSLLIMISLDFYFSWFSWWWIPCPERSCLWEKVVTINSEEPSGHISIFTVTRICPGFQRKDYCSVRGRLMILELSRGHVHIINPRRIQSTLSFLLFLGRKRLIMRFLLVWTWAAILLSSLWQLISFMP